MMSNSLALSLPSISMQFLKTKSFLFGAATVAFTLNLLTSSIAFSQEASAAKSTVPASDLDSVKSVQDKSATTESTASATTAADSQNETVTESKTFVATGSAYRDERLGISITPPSGWEIMTNTGSLSLVMREPKGPVVYDKAMYQRNITVAAIHRSSPIDEQRALELQAELTKSFGGDNMVSNFQIMEHKFFNYRGVNDGLVIYSSLNIGEFPMMQMHVLVSGQQKQFLMTYTDLAESFSDTKNSNFEQAWASLVSIDVTGMAPERRNELIRYSVIAGSIFSFLMVLMLLRRRASRKDFNAEADAMEESSYGDNNYMTGASASLNGTHSGWNFKKRDHRDDHQGDHQSNGIEFSRFASTF